MRIIAGELRSRVLTAPRGVKTRPTSDRLRETLFNVLGARVRGAHFADLFAGSGAVGLEALSRGAAGCIFVEGDRHALQALRSNIAALGVGGRTVVQGRSVAQALGAFALAGDAGKFDMVFLDPPYADKGAYTAALSMLAAERHQLLAPGAVVVAEHARRDALLTSYGALQRTRVLPQGDAALSFFAVASAESVVPGPDVLDDPLPGLTG